MTSSTATITTTDSTQASINDTRNFHGTVNFNDGFLAMDGLTIGTLGRGYPDTDVTGWKLSHGVLTLSTATGIAAQFAFNDLSATADTVGIQIVKVAGNSSFYVTEGPQRAPGSGTQIPGYVDHTPAAPQNVAVHDNTTGADLPDTSSAYTGPVVGVQNQFINITPDNLNITAKTDSLFIKTGSGNDAVAVRSGTNVVDCGAGSNFITGGSGFDTVFLDARNIPAAASAAGPVPGAIWDTIENFGPGDAATFWGIGTAAALSWQKDQGAVGHTGITLHANKQNGTEASLTLAGIDSKNGLSLSYGQSGGVDYLYVRAV